MPDAVPDAVSATGPQAVAALIQQARQVVRTARVLAEAGGSIDLAGLDHLVGIVCAQALDLPPADSRALRPPLATLLAECGSLGSTLRSPPRQKAASCPYPLRLS